MAKKRREVSIPYPFIEQKDNACIPATPAVYSNQAIRVREMAKLSKKFMRYSEAAAYYSIVKTKLKGMAKEAKAVYKVDNVALNNCEIFEKYLETFRL